MITLLPIVNTLIMAFLLLVGRSTIAQAHPCESPSNPVCKDILILKPRIDRNFALVISNAFSSVAREYYLPVHLLVSIAKQESDFRLESVRSVTGLMKLEDGTYVEGTVGSDFCMMQINASNIKKMKLNPQRLVSDPRYCIEAGAKILSFSRVHMKKEPSWWTRYNAISAIHRKVYHEHVLKHWRKLDPHVGSNTPSPG